MRTLVLDGEYDIARKSELEHVFESLPGDGPAVLDMTRVTYIDSTFLHALGSLRVRFEHHPITLIVRSEGVRRVLRLVKFDRLFRIVNS
jgi:anti-anti-sigma factor